MLNESTGAVYDRDIDYLKLQIKKLKEKNIEQVNVIRQLSRTIETLVENKK